MLLGVRELFFRVVDAFDLGVGLSLILSAAKLLRSTVPDTVAEQLVKCTD